MVYLLYGLGIGNLSIQKYFDLNNIDYVIYDDNQDNDDFKMNDIKLIIKSSGIANNTPLILSALENNIEIITDLEFFYRLYYPEDLICVTGSNGKTTVTSLLGETLKEEGYEVCGNIGIPIFDKIYLNKAKLIIEASSYMLEYTKHFKPHIMIILNLEKHHLDHHQTFVNYIKAKIKALKNMNEDDVIIYHQDNILLDRIIKVYNVNRLSFSVKDDLADCYLKDYFIYFDNKRIIDVNKLHLVGTHNIQNIMVTLLTLHSLKINFQDHLETLYNFKTLSHRLENIFPNKSNSALFINDSKSTNIHSLEVAIKTIIEKYINKKYYLIVGGTNINQDYSVIKKYEKVFTKIYFYGDAGKRYANILNKEEECFNKLENLLNILLKESFTEDDVILFSPGAPSYGEFKSYIERGNYFKMIIMKNQATN